MTEEPIDPTWWAAAVESESEPLLPELLSVRLHSLAAQEGLTQRQREVLEVLADVTSAMLQPNNWAEPFAPAMIWGGRRSVVPGDLSQEQLALLRELAPLIDDPVLKARVADAAWVYSKPRPPELLEMAVDAYRSIPLEEDAWYHGGDAAWQRALELGVRSGSLGRTRVTEMCGELKDAVLAAKDVGHRLVSFAAMMRTYGRWPEAERKVVAEALVSSAARPEVMLRVARHLEREASTWLASFDSASANDCTVRAARTYVAEADDRITSDPTSGALVEGHFLEKAIATLMTLPRAYRSAHGIDEEIEILRARLRGSRVATLEQMVVFESEPVDLSDAAAYARKRIAGHSSAWAALAAFANLMPPIDAEKTRQSAAEIVEGSISRIFSSATYSRDARKVAVGPDGTQGDSWSETVRIVRYHSDVVAQGLIRPAHEVLIYEHRYTRDFLFQVCCESPVVPSGHELLWAAGLLSGLNYDFGPAIAILVPQLEHLVRSALQSQGVHTLFVDPQTGVESEKGLNTLLEAPEASEIFGAGLVMEWQALLVDQSGPNLRNEIAHGLVPDSVGWSGPAIFAWWSCLRLVVAPLWQMSQEAPDGSPQDRSN